MTQAQLVVIDDSRGAAQVAGRMRAATEDGAIPLVLDPSWPPALRAEVIDAVHRSELPAPGDLVLPGVTDTEALAGLVRSAGSWDASGGPFSALTGIGAADVVWVPGPAHSTFFLHAAWHALAAGAHTVSTPAGGTPPPTVTVVHAIPGQLDAVRRLVDAGALPALRLVVCGASDSGRIGPAPDLPLLRYYGTPETSFIATANRDTPAMTPFPGVELEVRDETVWVRSPYLCKGVIGHSRIQSDAGWVSIGDRGRLTADGLVVEAQSPDVVTSAGLTVDVRLAERRIGAVPGVEAVAVVGAQRGGAGRRLTAVVVASGPVDRRTLSDATADLIPQARPREFLRATGIVCRADGTPDRRRIESMLAAGSLEVQRIS